MIKKGVLILFLSAIAIAIALAFILHLQSTDLSIQTLDSANWHIMLDTGNIGRTNGWNSTDGFPDGLAKTIKVPGNTWEAFPQWNIANSGEKVLWYSRTFTPTMQIATDMKYYLKFDAVQYSCDVWINGHLLGSHEGAEAPFEFDVTEYLSKGQNRITLRVFCPTSVFDKVGAYPVSYEAGGITQHVNLVAQPKIRIKDVFAKPDIKKGTIQLQITLENNSKSSALVNLSAITSEHASGNILSRDSLKSIKVPAGVLVKNITVTLSSPHLWSIDDPYLYSIKVIESSGGKEDDFTISHFGLRDFRINSKGYFELNGKRIYVKCTHSNFYDPIVTQGNSGDMTYLVQDFAKLKSAGFNMFRFLAAAPLPEQLDLADECGMLIYSEHMGSWLLKDQTKFNISMDGIIEKIRNHPSLVIWGLLNETNSELILTASNYLASLRNKDNTRMVFYNSGRWDGELQKASASNPGSSDWDVYLGGEDPKNPVGTGDIKDCTWYWSAGTGDQHIYQTQGTTWNFVTTFGKLASNSKPVFLSEAGIGSAYDPYNEKKKLESAGAPSTALAWTWITPMIQGMDKAFTKYGLSSIYNNPEDVLIDSQNKSAKMREMMFSIIRGNPKINGYSLTSMTDAGGAGEGIMDNFRDWKPGYFSVLQEGWAKLRWCLLVNPSNVYSDSPVHVKVVLANEDYLIPGNYSANLKITDQNGIPVWQQNDISITIRSGVNAPLAYTIKDNDITALNVAEGKYTLSATLNGVANASASTLDFTVTDRNNNSNNLGQVTVLGVSQGIKDLLISRGAVLHTYSPTEEINNEAIIVGSSVANDAKTWRPLYKKIAMGAHAVFLDKEVFSGNTTEINKWIAVRSKGGQSNGHSNVSIYPVDYIAKNNVAFNGLETKNMTSIYYGNILYYTKYLKDITVPDDTAAVAIYCSEGTYFSDGVMLGTYNHHAGKFTVNTFDIMRNLGNPAADRLLLNLVVLAKADAAAIQPLPVDYDAELDSLEIVN